VVGLPSLVTTSGWVLLWIIGAGRYVLPIAIGVPILVVYTWGDRIVPQRQVLLRLSSEERFSASSR
jgi:hypothetical protein